MYLQRTERHYRKATDLEGSIYERTSPPPGEGLQYLIIKSSYYARTPAGISFALKENLASYKRVFGHKQRCSSSACGKVKVFIKNTK